MKDLVVKDPAEIIFRAVKGMMAKNTIRNIILEKNLIIHAGPYHNHFAQKLPQFVPQSPLDINQELGIDSFTREDSTVIFESDPAKAPQELKDLPRELEENLAVPLPWQKKTHKFSKATIRKGRALNQSFRGLKKFRGE